MYISQYGKPTVSGNVARDSLELLNRERSASLWRATIEVHPKMNQSHQRRGGDEDLDYSNVNRRELKRADTHWITRFIG